MIRLMLALIGLLLATFIWIVALKPAFAHDWYDPGCCNDKDCAPVPGLQVEWTDTRIVFTVPPGVHPMAPEGGVYYLNLSNESAMRPSQDMEWHLCIYPGATQVMCAYIPGVV